MAKKGQTRRLTDQHKKSKGVVGIFGENARSHDLSVSDISKKVKEKLGEKYPSLKFRYRASLSKKEINNALKKLCDELNEPRQKIRRRLEKLEIKAINEDTRMLLKKSLL